MSFHENQINYNSQVSIHFAGYILAYAWQHSRVSMVIRQVYTIRVRRQPSVILIWTISSIHPEPFWLVFYKTKKNTNWITWMMDIWSKVHTYTLVDECMLCKSDKANTTCMNTIWQNRSTSIDSDNENIIALIYSIRKLLKYLQYKSCVRWYLYFVCTPSTWFIWWLNV